MAFLTQNERKNYIDDFKSWIENQDFYVMVIFYRHFHCFLWWQIKKYDFLNFIIQIMTKKPSKNQQSPQQILRRIEQESSDFKRLETLKILNRQEQIKPKTYSWWSQISKMWDTKYMAGKKSLFKTIGSQQNRHIAMITIFFSGAIFISWKIQQKYDMMRKRIRQTKSTKQKQVESQNEYINKMLLKNPFEPVPIQDEEEDKQNYIFEKADMEFDTKADLMQALQKDGVHQMQE